MRIHPILSTVLPHFVYDADICRFACDISGK